MAKRRCGCGCACGCLLFCYLYVGTGVGRLSAPAPSCYQFCPYFPLCLFSWKSATFVWLVGARARLDAEATSRTCVCGVGMIRACAQNRTLGFTTLAKIIYETYSMCATSRRCICVVFGLWALDVVGTEYHVEYVDHLGLVGGGLDPRRGRPRQRQDEQAQLCGHGSSRSSESPPVSRHRIKADKQLNEVDITCWGQEKYPTRAVPLFPLIAAAAAAATRGGLAGWTGTFQIAGKAEPSRNRQRAAVDKYRGL